MSVAALEAIADRVEATLQERPEKEIATAEIGAFVMEELKKLDKVAYVRFASVYRHFRDIGEFMNELKDLLNAEGVSAVPAHGHVRCHDRDVPPPSRRSPRRSGRARPRSARSATTRG